MIIIKGGREGQTRPKDVTLVNFGSLETPTTTKREDECASSHGSDSGGAFIWAQKEAVVFSSFYYLWLVLLNKVFILLRRRRSSSISIIDNWTWKGQTFPACPTLVSYASDSMFFHIIYPINEPNPTAISMSPFEEVGSKFVFHICVFFLNGINFNITNCK